VFTASRVLAEGGLPTASASGSRRKAQLLQRGPGGGFLDALPRSTGRVALRDVLVEQKSSERGIMPTR
jgi:hypothetical protein